MSQPSPLSIAARNRSSLKAPGLMADIFTVTLAQVNAGHIIIPGSGLDRLRVAWFTMIPNGAFGALTALRLITTESTPTVVASIAQANLTDDNVLVPGATGVTLTNLGVNLAAGAGLKIDKTGSDATTATDILVIPLYQRVR